MRVPWKLKRSKNNTGVDAILEVGLPGGYGFYGVADVLSGEVNPVRTSCGYLCSG